jgi:arylsulfatase A-like enzyme
MQKRYGLGVLLGVLLVANVSYGASDRELIVLVLVDALRPDHLGAYGYGANTSPHLDQLAAEGTRYTRAYVNAPWTRPSTASFLTGLNASRHGVETARDRLPTRVVTLAERLREAGWKSAAFVANGNGGSLARLQQGFDTFRDPTNAYTRKKRGKTYNGLPRGDFLVRKALKHLNRSKAQKEFLFLFLVDPHDPYGAPARLEKRFLGEHRGKVRRRASWEYKNNYPEAERRSMQAVYDASVAYADEALGTFFKALKKKGLYDNATIIVSADHGEGFGEHQFYLHAHHFWDEVIRVPVIIKGKGFAAGADPRLTQSLDITRTIAEIAGASTAGLPGRSLLAPPSPKGWVISEYNEFGIHRQAIVGQRYKVIWQRPADAAWFDREVKKRAYFPSVSFDKEVITVFDLEADPKERVNLALSPPKRASELLHILRDFVRKGEAEGS